MDRFFGMMPSIEIEKEEHYDTDDGTVILQAGKNGWTVLWGDHSSSYEDVVDSVENNFNKALKLFEKDYEVE